jgi:hypothetical protein
MQSGFGGMVGITEANPEEEGLWSLVPLLYNRTKIKDYYYACSIFKIF